MAAPPGLKEVPWEKPRWELHKASTCYFEQILEAEPHKTVFVQSLIYHLTNHPSKMNKTYWVLLEKQRQTHKRCFLWTPTHGRTSVGWPAEIYIHQLCANTGCSQEDVPRTIINRDRWWKRVKWIHAVCMSW